MNIPGNTALSDEAYAAQMDRVQALAERWQPLLGFRDWDMTVAYHRLPTPHEGNSLSKETEVTAMSCAADWRYMRILLNVDVEETATTGDRQLEFRVVHELMHAVLNECRQPDVSSRGDQYDWLDHEEHAATFLAKAFLRVLAATPETGSTKNDDAAACDPIQAAILEMAHAERSRRDFQGIRNTTGGMNLFQLGEFKLHSGQPSDFKVECDALTDDDIDTCAFLIARTAMPFGDAVGIPTGGHRLARALRKYITKGAPTIYVDDVWTTGRSMGDYMDFVKDRGYVIFSRGRCPRSVTPLFQMNDGAA